MTTSITAKFWAPGHRFWTNSISITVDQAFFRISRGWNVRAHVIWKARPINTHEIINDSIPIMIFLAKQKSEREGEREKPLILPIADWKHFVAQFPDPFFASTPKNVYTPYITRSKLNGPSNAPECDATTMFAYRPYCRFVIAIYLFIFFAPFARTSCEFRKNVLN